MNNTGNGILADDQYGYDGREVFMPYKFNNMDYMARFKMVLIDEDFKPDTPTEDNLELRQQFIDNMHNYFGIEDDSELMHFGTIYDSVVKPFFQEQQKALLKRVEEEVIGESDVINTTSMAHKRYYRDELRHEQRTKLNQIKEGLEGR